MDRAGWVSVGEILNAGIHEGWILDDLELYSVVMNDPKGRFEFSPDSWDDDEFPWHTARIRACSGHSLDVDLGLDTYTPTGDLFFGTVDSNAEKILRDGLTSKAHRHTRLLESEDSATAVAGQRRGGAPVVFRIDASLMHADGHVFHVAHNGEVLGPPVPANYITRVGCEPDCRPGI